MVQSVLSVPLKTAAQLFTLFKIRVVPMRLSPDTVLKYQLDYHYFGLAPDQRDYTLLTEADLQLCTTNGVTVCPAKAPLYHKVLTCEGSLFFQSSDSYQLCPKNMLRHYQNPTLLHHSSKWVYHFPDPRLVTIRRPQETGWFSRTVSLGGSGHIHNASACHNASPEIRTLPVPSKTSELTLDAPQVFLPDRIPAVSSHELAKIDQQNSFSC
jgi:hypothetical protein